MRCHRPVIRHIQPARVAALAVMVFAGCRKLLPAIPASRPSSQPTSVPATQPATQPVVHNYADFLQQRFPSYTTSKPSSLHLPQAEAAHLKLDQPAYCDSAGELWITDANAPPLEETLQNAAKADTHFVRETVLFVHRAVNAKGEGEPQLIVKSAAGDAAWLMHGRRFEISGGQSYAWRNAISWNNAIFVGTRQAVVRLTIGNDLQEQRVAFSKAGDSNADSIQLLPDVRGVLAWQACDDAAGGVARFVDGQWALLPGWPSNIIQLLPLLDGGVLTIARDERQNNSISQNYLDVAAADETRINTLIDELSDSSAEVREQASIELARWGASAWPILEKAQADQPPEAQVRIARLLESRTHPDLLGFRLKAGPIRVLARRGNSVMLAAANGVTFRRESDGDPVSVAPAVLTLDEHGVRLAASALADAALDPANVIEVCGSEWFCSNPSTGLRWWMSNHFTEPLLRKSERDFTQVDAIDNGGRILLRSPASGTSSSLLIDPSLPDQTPRLPVWVRIIDKGATGWTAEGWPVMQSGGAWSLTENQWKPVDGPKVITALPTPPSTKPTSEPSLLLTDSLHTQYFSAADGIQIVRRSGKTAAWIIKTGDPSFQLLECAGHLFVTEKPGELKRFSLPTDSLPQPILEATFTRRLPTEKIRRIWLDPAGRIDMAFDENGLAICFPDGRIPPRFAEMMTAEDLRLANEAAEPIDAP